MSKGKIYARNMMHIVQINIKFKSNSSPYAIFPTIRKSFDQNRYSCCDEQAYSLIYDNFIYSNLGFSICFTFKLDFIFAFARN